MSRVGDWMLRTLSRVTSSGRFLPEIDGLRFVAVASVVIYHAHGNFLPAKPDFASPAWAGANTLLLLGWFGVPLFFVISGFILALPFAERRLAGAPPASLKSYYLRRVTRLEPPYVICALILTTMAIWSGGFELADLARRFVAGVFYVHWFAYHEMNPVNRPTWTLEIEVQFYLLAPLLATVFAIRRTALRRLVLATAILAAAAQKVFWYDEFLFRTLPGQIQFFLVGFLLADVYLVDWKSAPVRRPVWDLVGIVAWAAMPAILLADELFELLLPLTMLLAYVAAFRGPWLSRFFRAPWIVVIGGMCYTIYLYHVTLIGNLRPLLVGDVAPAYAPMSLVRAAIVLLGVLVASAVLFVLFEKPFMRKDWPARVGAWFARRGRRATAPASVARGRTPA